MARGRTWLALLGALVVLCGLTLSMMAWRAHRSLSENPEDVLAALSEAIGLPVEADGVRARWWPPGLVVYGIRIPDRSPLGPGDLVHADEARLVVRFLPLLQGDVVVEKVEVVSPVVRLVRGTEGGWNLGVTGGSTVEILERESAEVPARVPGADPGNPEPRPAAAEGEAPAKGQGPTATEPRKPPGSEHGTTPRIDIAELVITRGRVSVRDRAIPGVPEFEISGADARLHRVDGGSTLEFEGSALGGPGGNLQGRLRVPDADADVELQITATDVPASRLPELLQLARGAVPFGATLDGIVSAEVYGRLRGRWPPGRASVGVIVDATEASMSMAGGYVRKPTGMPLSVTLDLLAGPELLEVRRAGLVSGDARVDVIGSEVDGDASHQQAALRVGSSRLTAGLLAEWVPMLAPIAPTGDLSLQGTIAPADGATALRVRLSGAELGLRLGRETAQLAAAAVDFDVRPEGRYTAGISLEGLQSGDLHAQRMTAAIEGRDGSPIVVRVDGARGGRGDTEVDRLALECEIAGESAEVRRFEVAGLGGKLQAQGQVLRDESEGLLVQLAPQWDGVDFSGLLRLLGVEVDIQGAFTGHAALSARQARDETFLETLSGVFEMRLVDGAFPELNVARATVDNLGVIPGLRQAIERRAAEKAPDLLARTSRIDALVVDGSLGEGKVVVSRLELQSPDYSLTATGRVGFDGAVDLDGDLVLGESATRALAVSGILSVLARPGEPIRIPVSIDGTYPELVSAPSPAFLSRSVGRSGAGQDVKGAGGFLRRLLGGGGSADAPDGPEAPDPGREHE